MSGFDLVLLAIDQALEEAPTPLEIDKLVAARMCLVDVTWPTSGSSTEPDTQRRAFVKWCSGCSTAKPSHAFNRNRRKRDGRQDVCRKCQRRIYQEHRGALAEDA